MLRHHLKHPERKHREWLDKVRPKIGESDDTLSPKVAPEGAWLWSLFNALNNQRAYGANGPQPISISDVAGLAAIHELSKADCRWLHEIVMILDKIFLEETYAKIAKEAKERQKKNKQPPQRGKR